MTTRKLDALRALAERPGTEAEGKVAREMLERLQKRHPLPPVLDFLDTRKPLSGARHAGRTDLADLIREMMSWKREAASLVWTCACGSRQNHGRPCSNSLGHLHIQNEIRTKFKPGDVVYYNRWAYDENAVGVVTGYVKLQAAEQWQTWAWIRVHLNGLASPRPIPIYSNKGWHLSQQPLSSEEAERLRQP